MRLTIYRTWRDGQREDDSNSRPRSPRNTHRPSPPNTDYKNFGDFRNGFNSGSNLDRSFRGTSQPSYRLPPMTTMGNGSSSFHSANRVAQTQTCGFAAHRMRSASVEDTEMTTPGPLRSPSQYDNEMQTPSSRATSSQPPICSCNKDERMTASPSPTHLATAAYSNFRPYARIPVNDVLNHSPPSGSQTQKPNGESSRSPKTGSSSSEDFDHPMLTPSDRSPSHLKKPVSSISSNSTLRPPFDVAAECCYLLNTLYHICTDASSSYIANLLPATRHSNNQLPRHRNHGIRYQPYPSPRRGRTANGASYVSASMNARRRTLMDNISTISTHIWRRARSDEMAPHRAEADAVLAMRDLYTWSETVVRGIEREGVGLNLDRAEDAEDQHDMMATKVAYAAKNLCQWLGDEQAWDDCHAVMGELRELMDMDGGGGRCSEVDEESSESTDGSVG